MSYWLAEYWFDQYLLSKSDWNEEKQPLSPASTQMELHPPLFPLLSGHGVRIVWLSFCVVPTHNPLKAYSILTITEVLYWAFRPEPFANGHAGLV